MGNCTSEEPAKPAPTKAAPAKAAPAKAATTTTADRSYIADQDIYGGCNTFE